jgi:hypothetical protein
MGLMGPFDAEVAPISHHAVRANYVGCGEARTASLMFVSHGTLLLMRFAQLTTSYAISSLIRRGGAMDLSAIRSFLDGHHSG